MNCSRFLVVLICCALAAPAYGQLAPSSDSTRVVASTGTVVIKRMPTAMKFAIQFKESGKDLTEAIKNLKDRQQAASATLIKFGAKKESIRESAPSLVPDVSASARAMMSYPGRPNSKRKKSTTPAPVNVSGSISAEWSLPVGSVEELLAFTKSLQDKIKVADLAGNNEKKKLSAEEQEEKDEQELLQQQFEDGSSIGKPGEPMYWFVAKLSSEESQKARAAAFQKARQQAEQLASAANIKLGKLRGLQSPSDDSNPIAMMHAWRSANPYYGPPGTEPPALADLEDQESHDDATSRTPTFGKVSFSFSIHAAFDIE